MRLTKAILCRPHTRYFNERANDGPLRRELLRKGAATCSEVADELDAVADVLQLPPDDWFEDWAGPEYDEPLDDPCLRRDFVPKDGATWRDY